MSNTAKFSAKSSKKLRFSGILYPFLGEKIFLYFGSVQKISFMKKLLALCLLLTTALAFSQATPKKLVGKWVCCEKIDALTKLDAVTLVKDDAATEKDCIEKSCAFSRWTFEKTDAESKVEFYRQAGCKDAASASEKTFNGTWNIEKDKKTLTIFDDHFTKHTYTIESLTDKELKLKRQ